MKIAALAGWGQPHNALAAIVPGALHLEYAQHKTLEQALVHLEHTLGGYETLIGWSLGGQLLVRAVAQKRLAPQRLVLLATPLQFLATADFAHGMGRATYQKFRENYEKNPRRTLDKAWELLAVDDKHAARIRAALAVQDKEKTLEYDWLRWFALLEDFKRQDLPLSHFPPTLLVHGKNDVVVKSEQSVRLAEALPCATLALWDGCGHAPHWHDPEALRKLIEEFHVRR